MSSSNASARRDAASASIQQLRLRLLDLTGRNPRINFDHTSRSICRANIRAINAGMDGIYGHLTETGKLIPLTPLPRGPGDETPPGSLAALELAKDTDRDYTATMASC